MECEGRWEWCGWGERCVREDGSGVGRCVWGLGCVWCGRGVRWCVEGCVYVSL